ncbi:MAG: helix-turn-helix domain-containing protein [Candidatus Omnitrophica bacterium]|nr:helix-turn-helix domain-containing protein [Candidatus Omnitrophota bacterium]MCM8803299.1 helix-turn-helix domain-containing protein [Candidatus Omnitrophota bacterium]
MGKILFANIKKQDVEKLFEFLKSEKEHIKKRVHLIILSGIHRYRVSEISRIVKIHPNHLRKWIHRYNKDGLEAILQSPEKGRKKNFGHDIKEKIIKIVHIPPRKLGLLFSNWTLYKLKKFLEEKKIVEKISHETIRRILKEANIDFKKIDYEEN